MTGKRGGRGASARASGFFPRGDPRKGEGVFPQGFGNSSVTDELAFATTFDEGGFAEDLEVMRNGGGSDAAHGYDFSAIHFRPRGDGLEDFEARLIGQSFGNLLNLLEVHGTLSSLIKFGRRGQT